MNPTQPFRQSLPVAVCLALAMALVFFGCQRGREQAAEVAYVSVRQANMRDRVAAVYNKVGTVNNGEKVVVLDKKRRFVQVKTARGEVGWLEERYLVDAGVYDGFQKLAAGSASLPVQAHATTRASLNMHLTPGREAEHLIQLPEAAKLVVLRRETAEKPSRFTSVLRQVQEGGTKKASAKSEEPPVALEDWLLVRDQQGHTGWVLSRMLDLDVPLEIAQYSEGQRIVAYFMLNQVADDGKNVPQFLVLYTENKDGLPWDYDQARVFTWNLKRHRYETAYRERKLVGVFPVTVGTANFDKEGLLPTFTLRVKDDDGKTVDKQYKLNGPIVRRVLSPEEEQARAAQPKARRRHRH